MKQLAVLKTVVVLLSLSVVPGFGQAADSASPTAQTAPAASDASAPTTQAPATADAAAAMPTVTLDESLAAAKAGSPNLKLTGITQDTARAALTQALARSGMTLGESGDYYHQGSVSGTSTPSSGSAMAAAAAGGSGTNGENLKGGLSLTGPATSIGLTAQHSIAEGGSSDQVSSLVLSGSQTVFDGYPGGQATAAVQQAEAAYRIAQATYDAEVKSTVYQVKQAYYTLLGDQDTVTLRQAIAEQAAENLALYQGLYKAQKATSLDVLQVQVAMTQAQLDVRTAQNTVETDRKRLSLAVGWPLDKQYSVADSPLPDLPALGPDAALSTAMKNRSELLILAQNGVAADVALALQKSQGLPVVSLKASLGVGQDWTANVNNGAFTAGVSIALPPVYDGGLQGAAVKQAADQVASVAVQQAQEQQSIAIDVQNALFGVTDAKDRHALAEQNLAQAQGQYDLQKEKLAVGLGTVLDELTAFSTLATARVGLEQAKITYLLAVLNLDNVMGL